MKSKLKIKWERKTYVSLTIKILYKGNEGMEIGAPGFDAPENVAFAIADLLYGEGDFGKSLCLANSLGEDTDCTCASIGAAMGIVLGASGLPEKWAKPLDDKIVTMCIDKTSRGIWVPETSTQLAERILRVVPGFLGQELCDAFAEGGMEIRCREKEELYCKNEPEYVLGVSAMDAGREMPIRELCELSPYVVRFEYPAFCVMIDYNGSVFYKKGENRKIRVKVVNTHLMRQQHWAKITLYLPEGVQVCGSHSVELPLNYVIGSSAETEFEISAEQYSGSRLEFIVDVSLVGRHSSGPIKVTLLCGK